MPANPDTCLRCVRRMNQRHFIVILCSLASPLFGCGERYTSVLYKDTILRGQTSESIDRLVQRDPNIIPDLFVRTPAGEVFELQHLPQNVVSELEGVRYESVRSVGGPHTEHYYFGETSLTYQDGNLFLVSFGEGPLEIGANEGGPFRKFPMTLDEVHEVFGEPEREGRVSGPMFRWF